jgi:hypothetical protein
MADFYFFKTTERDTNDYAGTYTDMYFAIVYVFNRELT